MNLDHNGRLRPQLVIFIPLVTALILGTATLILFFLNRHTPVPASWGVAGGPRNDPVYWFNAVQSSFLVPAAAGVLGALILHRRVEPRIGTLFLLISLIGVVMSFLNEYVVYGFYTQSGASLTIAVTAWVVNFLWVLFFGGILYLLAIFPNGRFLSRRWEVVIKSCLFLFMGLLLIASMVEDPLSSAHQIANPFISYFPEALYILLFNIGVPLMPLTAVIVLLSTLVRIRRSSGRERQQMKWLLAGTAILVIAVFSGLALDGLGITVGGVIINAAILGPLLGVGIALLRHQLYDIDIIIRRTLLYGAVSVALALCYFGSVLLLQSAFSTFTVTRSPMVIVISTLVSAALFNPLRSRLQTLIDRHFFRQKYDSQRVLARFAQTARDETDLERLSAELLEVVQKTLQPDQTEVWLRPER